MTKPLSLTGSAIFCFMLFVSMASYGQADCCQSPDCKSNVILRINSIKSLLAPLGKFPHDVADQDTKWYAFKKANKDFYKKIKHFMDEEARIEANDRTWGSCFSSLFNTTNVLGTESDILNWKGYLREQSTKGNFNSPEFHKGGGVHFDINQGVADVGKTSESYSFAARVLLSFTLPKKGKESGGHWRIMIGPSYYHTNVNSMILLNPRIEYRLLDIGNDLTSVGNLKLIADTNFGERSIVGGGIGLELYHFGAQILFQGQNEDKSSHILMGLFYRIQPEK